MTAALGRLQAKEEASFADCRLFGLRGGNLPQVRHILARLTAHLEESIGRPHDVVAYLDPNRYQIEHMWPKHHAHVKHDIADPMMFRALRNRFGGLGLLRRSDNAAISDMPFRNKLDLYGRSLAVLAPGFDVRNKTLRDFVNANDLKDRTPIVFTHAGEDYWAKIDADGGIVLESTGVTYDKADDAGAAIRDRTTCPGMDEWRVVQRNGERLSLRALRDHAETTGRMGRRRR